MQISAVTFAPKFRSAQCQPQQQAQEQVQTLPQQPTEDKLEKKSASNQAPSAVNINIYNPQAANK